VSGWATRVIQFLVDECLTPRLVEVANGFGYVAHHVQYRNWKSRTDQALLAFIRDEDLTIVTNNWKDFEPMLRREELHPGAVVIPNVPRAGQIAAFELALRAITTVDPPLDMINTVVEVDESDVVRVYPLP
jgi:predicted nuclease of predicted toxin-antitoxin system